MNLKLAATVEVNEKYAPQVTRMFEQWAHGLDQRVGGLVLRECNAKQIPQSISEGHGAGDRGERQARKGTANGKGRVSKGGVAGEESVK